MTEKKLLKFEADWCGPCQTQEPIVEEFEEDNPEVEVEAIDVDEHQERANEYHVRGLPTLVLLEDEEVSSRWTGVTQKEDLESVL